MRIKKLFYQLQALNIPIALIVNKIDNDKEEQTRFWEFTSFGAKNIFAVSVSHNRKLNPFYKWLERYIPPKKEALPVTLDEEEFDPLYDEPPK